MNPKKLFPIFLMILLLVLAACGGTEPADTGGTEAEPDEQPAAVAEEESAAEESEPEPEAEEEEMAAEAEPIKIGSSLPLTGGFSIPGTKHQQGYELCVAEINARGGLLGRPVELLAPDNRSEVETAISQYERLINEDNVDLLFGTFSSRLTVPVSAIAEQNGMVFPIPAGGALRIYERGFENLFYFQQNAAEFVGDTPIEVIQELLPEEQRPQTVAVVKADDFFANGIYAGLLGEEVVDPGSGDVVIDLAPGSLADAGIEAVFTETWPEEGFSDWLNLANSLRTADADMLIALTASPDEAVQLMLANETVGYQPDLIYMSQGTQQEFFEGVGSGANGVMIHASWHPNANWVGQLLNEPYDNATFLQAYRDMYGGEADEDVAIPFALCQGMAQAVEATGSTDNDVIREWLQSRDASAPVRTILGDFHWNEKGLPQGRAFLMTQWQEDELRFIYPLGEFEGTSEILYAGEAIETDMMEGGEASGEPIKIGSSLPLTGGFSIPGTKHQQGYQLCVDEINAAGGLLGRPVELLAPDNRSEVETAISQYERLINEDNVDLLFGTFSSRLTVPVSAIAEQNGMVFPIPAGGALRIYERGFENLFYFQQNAAEFVGDTPIEVLQALVGDNLPGTVAVVKADDFFANGIYAGLLGEEVVDPGSGDVVIDLAPGSLADAGIEVAFTETWPEEGFSDWLNLANSLRNADADFLIALTASPDEAVQLMLAIETVGYAPDVIYMSQGTQQEFFDGVGENANGVMIHASWHPNANWTGELLGESYSNFDFIAAYEAQYGSPPDEDVAIPFALCQGMVQAVAETGSTDNDEIRAWLNARTVDDPVMTVLGPFHWNEKGLPEGRAFLMTQWQDNELKFIYPIGEFPGTVDIVYPKP